MCVRCAVVECNDNINRLMTVSMMTMNDSFALKFVCIPSLFGLWICSLLLLLLLLFLVIWCFDVILSINVILHMHMHTHEPMIPLTGISIRKICNHMAHRRWSIHLTIGDTKTHNRHMSLFLSHWVLFILMLMLVVAVVVVVAAAIHFSACCFQLSRFGCCAVCALCGFLYASFFSYMIWLAMAKIRRYIGCVSSFTHFVLCWWWAH